MRWFAWLQVGVTVYPLLLLAFLSPLGGGWWQALPSAAVSWLFKPIRAIREGASQIGRGNFNHRIDRIRRDQLGDLAADINELASDVEGMLDAKRALLLGISHELRTPLSRMRLALEFVDNDEDRETLRPEIAEMEKIVVALLEAERLSTRHDTLSRSKVQVEALQPMPATGAARRLSTRRPP